MVAVMSVSTAATAKPFSYDGAGQEREEAKVEDTPSWKFAQCFGDKNEAAEISEGTAAHSMHNLYSRRHIGRPV